MLWGKLYYMYNKLLQVFQWHYLYCLISTAQQLGEPERLNLQQQLPHMDGSLPVQELLHHKKLYIYYIDLWEMNKADIFNTPIMQEKCGMVVYSCANACSYSYLSYLFCFHILSLQPTLLFDLASTSANSLIFVIKVLHLPLKSPKSQSVVICSSLSNCVE